MKTKARYEVLHCVVSSIRFRAQSAAGDVVVLSIWSEDDGQAYSAKGRETDEAFEVDRSYSLFGEWSKYFNKRTQFWERQFSFFGYCAGTQLVPEITALLDLFLGRGFPRALAICCVHAKLTRELVERNPFRLLAFGGCGFKRCDDLYLSLGLPKDRLKRQVICLWNELRSLSDGSIWATQEEAVAALVDKIPEGSDFRRAAALATRAKVFSQTRTDNRGIEFWDGDQSWYALRELADREQSLARCIGREMQLPSRWPEIPPGNLSDHQAEKLKLATSCNVGVLTGGGGTGKTFVTAHLIREIARVKGRKSVLLCAPTGKAAVRLTEAVGGVVSARTIHSALGYRGDGWITVPFADQDYRYVFADESSMTDLELMDRFFRAARDCSVLLIGDPYQLPPVGPGAPFRDLIDVHPRVGLLTEVRRNSGSIVAAGDLIRQGKTFDEHLGIDNLFHLERTTDAQVTAGILAELENVGAAGFDPVWDAQVLVQVNQRSKLSTSDLNATLQEELNHNPPIAGKLFRLNDKVLNSQNSWLGKAKDLPTSPDATVNMQGEIYVANGEIGRVVEIDAKMMVVELQSPLRNVVAPTWSVDPDESDEGDTGSRFQLGYAITVHKSQGSQWPYVVGVLDSYSGARRLFDRSLLYTMISRASRRCTLIGPMRVATGALKRNSIWERRTFLRERLKEEWE